MSYLIFWTNDEYGKRVLAEARELRTSLPEDKVAFVYLCEDFYTRHKFIIY